MLLVSPFDDVLSIRFIILGFAEDDVLPHPIRRQPVFKLAEVRKVHFLWIEEPFWLDVGGQQRTTKSLTHFPSESQRQTVIGRHLCRGKIDEDLRLETSCARQGDRVSGVRVWKAEDEGRRKALRNDSTFLFPGAGVDDCHNEAPPLRYV